MEDSAMNVRLLSEDATIPRRSTDGSAGYDLYSAERAVLSARSRGSICTGIALAIPMGYYGRIASRSGLSVRHGIEVGAGVIDSDYRGEIVVVLYNHGDEDYGINIGTRIAQIIFSPVHTPMMMEVDALEDTSRGALGFGSSGV